MTKPLVRTGYDGKSWLLIDVVTQHSVTKGDVVSSFRGERATVVGGSAPHKPSSTGRVEVDTGLEFYPSVFGLQWIRI